MISTALIDVFYDIKLLLNFIFFAGEQIGKHELFPIDQLWGKQKLLGQERKHTIVLDYYHNYRLLDIHTFEELARFTSDDSEV